MKTSDLADLLRLIMYDIMGLAMPGLALLFLLFEYATTTKLVPTLTALLGNRSAFDLAVVILIGYMLGYALQAVSYLHFRLFDEVGWRLMGKSVHGRSGDHGVSAASRFTGRYFEATPFYRLAKQRITDAAKLVNEEDLTFSDIQNLAFSIAGGAADKASQFQFRADICGALATLSLITALALMPLWEAQGTPIPCLWWSVEIGIVLWLAVAVAARLLVSYVSARIEAIKKDVKTDGLNELQKEQVDKLEKDESRIHIGFQYLWWIIPLLTGTSALVLRLTYSYLPYWWVIPLLFFNWFAFLYRAFFYTDIRGRIIFHIAVAEIWRASTTEASKS
jgi:hypothetical protein